ncbi:S-layer homology domain-containing protein [Clostridium sp. 'deep sea']|uniref:S-layer homology domain-containing protein n=1 Tax=Clostridium sp. 'deep sea' TaxID=2779445 RepID=UPI0018968809|nr:S-layer homology domain-containing protein [Clostridium sp. 'deep sea']QOR35277.1 S-layer homology domain-containing protein [Clostridium sp. 'deep sea']
MTKTLSKILIITMLLTVIVVPAFAEDKVMQEDKCKITITNIVGQTKETLKMYNQEREYDIYLVTKGARITVSATEGLSCGVSALVEEDGSYYGDPWPWEGTGEFRSYIDANQTAYNDLEGCTYYKFFYEKNDERVIMMFKLVEDSATTAKEKEFKQPDFNTDKYELTITNIIGETTETLTIDEREEEYKVYLISKDSKATIKTTAESYAGGGIVRNENGYMYSDPCLVWNMDNDKTSYSPLLKANTKADMNFEGSTYYYFSTGEGDNRNLFLLKVVDNNEQEKVDGDLNHELYDLSITNYDKVVKETLTFNNETKEYDVYVAKSNSLLTYKPTDSFYAGVLEINLDEGYAAPMMWTINGHQELVNYVEADTVATCELKPGYYQFAVDDDNGSISEVIIKVVAGEKVTEPIAVEFDENDAPDNWAKGDITSAIQKNLVPLNLQNNYKQNITRKEFCQAVIQLLETKTSKTAEQILADVGRRSNENDPFTDTSEDYILAAYQLKIIGGRGNKIFDPNGTIIRQEAAAILTNVARVLGADVNGVGKKFADDGDITNYAKASVDYVSSKGIMGAMGNNKFGPKTTYTRQQSYITLLRLFNALK